MTDHDIDIRISRIRELHAINTMSRIELLRQSGGEILVSLNSRLIPLDGDRIAMVIGVRYRRERSMIVRTLLHYHIEVVFEIRDIDNHIQINGDTVSVAPRLLSVMYTTAIGALRGMLAQRTARTILADHPLPLINVSELVSRQLYPGVTAVTIPFTDLTYA